MISITIEGTAQQVREEMRALMGLDRDAPAETPAEAPANKDKSSPGKPKATRSTKANTSPEKDAETPTVASETGVDGTVEGTTASPSEERDLSEKAMRERITQYSAKAGPVALTEMQKAAGAPNGKFSEVMADPEALAKLDALLADAGF
jgi:hypothetical protein